MKPLIDETILADGRRYRVSWFDPPFRPPLDERTRALGIYFTAYIGCQRVQELDGELAPYSLRASGRESTAGLILERGLAIETDQARRSDGLGFRRVHA